MNWKPNIQEGGRLGEIIDLCHDALIGQGPADRQTFCMALRAAADKIDAMPAKLKPDELVP